MSTNVSIIHPTYKHLHVHTCTYTFSCTRAFTNHKPITTFTYKHILLLSHVLHFRNIYTEIENKIITYIHIRTCPLTNTPTHILYSLMHTCTHFFKCTPHTHTYTHKHTHLHIHTHTHTLIHIHAYTCASTGLH